MDIKEKKLSFLLIKYLTYQKKILKKEIVEIIKEIIIKNRKQIWVLYIYIYISIIIRLETKSIVEVVNS
jgi:hypothetical protein